MGLEYSYKKMASVRGGYKFRLGSESAEDEEGITLGFGINTNLSSTALSLDYAFADFGRLQQAHRVSMGLRF